MRHQTPPMIILNSQCSFNLGSGGRGGYFKNFVIGCHTQFLINELPAQHLWQKFAGDESTKLVTSFIIGQRGGLNLPDFLFQFSNMRT